MSAISRRGRPRTRPARGRSSVGRGVPFRSQSRKMILSARDFFEEEARSIVERNAPLIPFERVRDRTAKALNVSKCTVSRVAVESINSPVIMTPGKSRPRQATVTNLDTFQQDAIRRHIYSFYARKEYPTVSKLLVTLKKSELFVGSYSSLLKVVHYLGFEYQNINRRKLLLERSDVVSRRWQFIQKILKKELMNVVWLDETWVNAGHHVSKGWTDGTTEATPPGPTGRGGRLIVCHAGTADGFINNALLIFRSKKTGDYHEEMDQHVFRKWFETQLLPNVNPNSTIVMDNAPYHTVRVDKAPTTASRKEHIISWLERHGVNAVSSLTKGALLALVDENKPPEKYIIDELAKSHGHEVIRLPPYHCHFNPIELIWAQIKNYIAKENKSFTMKEIEKLTLEAINRVTAREWRKCVQHVEKEIRETKEREGILDDQVDQLIIRLEEGEGSSESSDGDEIGLQLSDDEMDGIQPLEEEIDNQH